MQWTKEERLDAQDARLREAVVEAALVWRRHNRQFLDACKAGRYLQWAEEDDAKWQPFESALDALLAFLGEGST